MFLDIMADVLLGTPEIPGILPDILAALGAPERLTSLLLYRPLFLALFTALVAAPISLHRSMASLDGLNVAGLAALCAFGLSLAWLSAAAVLQGRAHPMPLWPGPPAADGGGGGGGSSSWRQALVILSVLPAMLTADGCHLNVLPLAAMMRPFSKRSMDSVVAISIVRMICLTFCLTLTLHGCCGHELWRNLNYSALFLSVSGLVLLYPHFGGLVHRLWRGHRGGHPEEHPPGVHAATAGYHTGRWSRTLSLNRL